MRHLVTLGLLAIVVGACKNEGAGGRGTETTRPGAAPESHPGVTATAPPPPVPYSGYPGPAERLDAGAADAGTRAVPADGGLAQPPSTAQPGGRPTYPDAGAPRR